MNECQYPSSFQPFSDLLKDRFNDNIYTTEDSVRYLFFSALLNHSEIFPNEVILEYPHPEYGKKKVDTYIPAKNGRHGMVAEFKYDRKIPSEKNKPRPHAAGKLFADISRLACFNAGNNNTKRYFIYLTDGEMLRYLGNPKNGLKWFINGTVGDKINLDSSLFIRLSRTFNESAGEIFPGTSITPVFNDELPHHILRIYEVNCSK